MTTNGGLDAQATGGMAAQIVEVVPDADGEGGETIFELRVAEPERSWIVYRSERISSLCPN